MKGKLLLPLIGCLLFFGIITSSFGQSAGTWSTPQSHPCYQGIKISVMNMGYGKEGGGYMWGVRFTNFYKLSVSFKYKLSIGEKIVAASDGETCSNLGNGISKIDGRDKATAKIFQSPSEEWNLYIWNVCFEGMSCGGANNCYAECDKQPGKENQLCGLMDDYKPTPGSNLPSVMSGKEAAPPAEVKTPERGPVSTWIRDDKSIKLLLQKTPEGVYATREGLANSNFFKKISENTYRMESGSEFYIIKFDGEKKFNYWNSGVLENSFTLVEVEVEEPDNPVPVTVQPGIWISERDTIGIKIAEGGIELKSINPEKDKNKFFKQVGPNRYKWSDEDTANACYLIMKDPNKMISRCGGNTIGKYQFSSPMQERRDGSGNIIEYALPADSEWEAQTPAKGKIFFKVNYDQLIYAIKASYSCTYYDRIAANTYRRSIDDKTSETIKIVGADKMNMIYSSPSKNSTSSLQLIASTISEPMPADTIQGTPTISITGKWQYLGENNRRQLEISNTDEGLKVRFLFWSDMSLSFKKGDPWIYTVKGRVSDEAMYKICTLKYINNNTLLFSLKYGALTTVSYFTRIDALK